MNKHDIDLQKVDASTIKHHARDISVYDSAKSIREPLAVRPGSFDLPTACTWHTIWDGGIFSGREYRIHCDGGTIDVEVNGVVVFANLTSGNSTDVSGNKIRVHAKVNNSRGQYDRL